MLFALGLAMLAVAGGSSWQAGAPLPMSIEADMFIGIA